MLESRGINRATRRSWCPYARAITILLSSACALIIIAAIRRRIINRTPRKLCAREIPSARASTPRRAAVKQRRTEARKERRDPGGRRGAKGERPASPSWERTIRRAGFRDNATVLYRNEYSGPWGISRDHSWDVRNVTRAHTPDNRRLCGGVTFQRSISLKALSLSPSDINQEKPPTDRHRSRTANRGSSSDPASCPGSRLFIRAA